MELIKDVKNRIIQIIGKDNIEFISHVKNYLSGKLFVQALSIISIPIMTRLLVPKDYGILAVFSSIISLFSVLLGLVIRGSVNRYYFEENSKDNFGEFLGSNLIFILIYNLFAISFLYVFKNIIADFFKISVYLFFISILISFLNIPDGIFFTYLRATKQSKRYSFILIIKSILLLVITIVWVYSLKENRYYGKIYSIIIITAVFAVYMIYNLVKLSKFKFKLEYIKYSIRYSIPLIPHALSNFILSFFDRIIINQLTGAKNAGLYSFAYNVGTLMVIVTGSMNTAWLPIFYENLTNKNFIKIKKLAYNYSKYIYFTAIGLILFSKEVVSLMADEKYHTALPIVPIIIISHVLVFLYTLYVNYVFYRKKTILISLITLFVSGINIGLNYWLIPIYGYIAAAYTTLISYFLLFLFHFLNLKYILKEKNIIPIGKILSNFGWVILAVLVFVFTNNYINIFVISLIVKVLFVVFVGWMFFIKDRQ